MLCRLTGDWRILQRRDGHRWSLDDLVTAWLAARTCADAPPARIADLGCGIGAVLLMLAWRFPAARCEGFEAQPASVALARRSIRWNGAGDRCAATLADLREIGTPDPFDLVTGTPPYLPVGSATEPRRAQQAGCHLELRGGIEDYCAAAMSIAPAGRFVVCHSDADRAERAARSVGLAIEERIDVIPRQGKERLFSTFAMRAAGDSTRQATSTLVVRDRTGAWTAEFRALRSDMGMPA